MLMERITYLHYSFHRDHKTSEVNGDIIKRVPKTRYTFADCMRWTANRTRLLIKHHKT